jgi:exosortase/archaeosortase family protein
MKKFLFLYWFNIALLFGVFYWDKSFIAVYINNFQTDFVSYLVSFFLSKDMMKGHDIIINKHYHLIIENACNGLVPYYFFLASILAFPSIIADKIKWAIIGYISIISINVLRIWIITKLVLESKNNFTLAHDWIGNIMLVFTSLGLFILFIKTRKKDIS